jgi:hypothetical protein
MAKVSASAGIAASIHGRRRPRRVRVRSLRVPAIGSATASHTRPKAKMTPTVAGAIRRTSVANLRKKNWM